MINDCLRILFSFFFENNVKILSAFVTQSPISNITNQFTLAFDLLLEMTYLLLKAKKPLMYIVITAIFSASKGDLPDGMCEHIMIRTVALFALSNRSVLCQR